jgi:hypothetical protein
VADLPRYFTSPQSALSHLPVMVALTLISRPCLVLVETMDPLKAVCDCASVRTTVFDGLWPVQVIVLANTLDVFVWTVS